MYADGHDDDDDDGFKSHRENLTKTVEWNIVRGLSEYMCMCLGMYGW